MNCPDCHEPVGDDQYGRGFPQSLSGSPTPRATVRSQCTLAISCSHCGVFEIIERTTVSVVTLRGPITNDRNLRRLEKLIPACRQTRRQPAPGARA